MHVCVRELGNLTQLYVTKIDVWVVVCVCARVCVCMRMNYLYMLFDYQCNSVRAYKITLMLLLQKLWNKCLRAVL